MNFRDTFHLADCLDLMRQLPAGGVDFICVDPPYHTTRLGFDQGPRIDWAAWWREADRVLKPAGVVSLFAADRFLFEMYDANPRAYRYRLVWEKSRMSRFLDANRRPLQAHEDILVFCREPRKATYNPQKVFRPEIRPGGRRFRPANATDHYCAVGSNSYVEEGFRHPGTVLRFGSGSNRKQLNPTQKPLDLIRWLVRTYSNPGDVVLDTCAGSATTAVACLEEGRSYVCVERDAAQYFTAAQRIADQATREQRVR